MGGSKAPPNRHAGESVTASCCDQVVQRSDFVALSPSVISRDVSSAEFHIAVIRHNSPMLANVGKGRRAAKVQRRLSCRC